MFSKTGELIAFAVASHCMSSSGFSGALFRSGANELSISDPAVSFVVCFGAFPLHRYMQIKFLFFKYFCSDP